MNNNFNRSTIKITNSNANVNNFIKVVPNNEYTKDHSKQLFVKFTKPTDRQLDILQFMDDSTSNYNFSEKPIFLQQIINKRGPRNNGEPEFGMGSSFKRQQRHTRAEVDVPSTYTITIDKANAQKKFKTVPQEMNPNSQYLIFVRKSESLFEACPLENWYKINPFTKLDINSIEESERDQLKKGQMFDSSSKKFAEKYKVEEKEVHKNEIEFGNEDRELSDSEIQEKQVLNKRKKDTVFQRKRHGQGDAHAGESDVDDHQGDEVDYMSDSSCDEDVLSDGEKEKLYEAVDVDQEAALLEENPENLSDQSDNGEDEKKDDKVEETQIIEDDDDDDDDDDNDNSDYTESEDDNIPKTLSKSDYNNNLVNAALKRPMPADSSNYQNENKKVKFSNPKLNEILQELRKHLTRKPIYVKDLFKILMKKNLLENNDESKKLFYHCLDQLKAISKDIQGKKYFNL